MSSPASVAKPVERHASAVPYVLPFGVFLLLLAAAPYLRFLGSWEFYIRLVVLTAVTAIASRSVLQFQVRRPVLTIVTGVIVFVVWIAPDLMFPAWRSSVLFQNGVMGQIHSSIDPALRNDRLVLIARALRAVLLVPVIEELFWRGWLMRWIINPRFDKVPLGSYTRGAMWITALLFASEHGPYWDVGLLAGLAYNFLMVRTKSLGDCILAHAITNGCLSAYVVLAGRWEYWM